jgi:hypothetical protein
MCSWCLEHVINLANIAMMGYIMKIAVIENMNAIWGYDPSLLGNRVLDGSLDVVVAICTLAIKVMSICFQRKWRHSPALTGAHLLGPDSSIRAVYRVF